VFVLVHPVITIYFQYQSSTGVLIRHSSDRVHYRCLLSA